MEKYGLDKLEEMFPPCESDDDEISLDRVGFVGNNFNFKNC